MSKAATLQLVRLDMRWQLPHNALRTEMCALEAGSLHQDAQGPLPFAAGWHAQSLHATFDQANSPSWLILPSQAEPAVDLLLMIQKQKSDHPG